MTTQFGLAALMLSLSISGAFAADRIDVRLGNSQVIGPVEQMATVIIGNTGVADATLGGGGTIILTGKVLGSTNLIVLDESGRELLSSDLNVVPLDNRPTTTLRISRGVSTAQSYVCGASAGCTPANGAMAYNASNGEEPVDGAPIREAPEVSPEADPEAPEATPDSEAPVSEEMISLNP